MSECESMKGLLDHLDQVDKTGFLVDVNHKINRLSGAIMFALAEIEGYENDCFHHGSIATLLEVKRILLEATI